MSQFFYFVLLGAPGSGKGTQGEILASHFNLLRISPGEILREIVKKNPSDPLSLEISSHTDKGNLIPVSMINKILLEYIDKKRSKYKGILFDGYPRSIEQDDFLSTNIAIGGPDAWLYLETSLDQLLNRLLYRQVCDSCGKVFNTKYNPSKSHDKCDNCGQDLKQRADDSSREIITNRFKVFNEQALPIIEKYSKQQNFFTVDANKDISVLSSEMIDILGKIIYV